MGLIRPARGGARGLMRRFDLIAFDVDGTLVSSACGRVVWQLVHHRFVRNPLAGAPRFEAFLARAITYREWVDLDLWDWVVRGVRRADLVALIAETLSLAPGVPELLDALVRRGYRLAVI